MSGGYLSAFLAPLAPWLQRPDVTDLMINRPGEVWVETASGVMTKEAAPDLSEGALLRLARQIAASTHQGVSRETPLLSATLPGGERVQVVAPPATRAGVVMAIRRHGLEDFSLRDLEGAGFLTLQEEPRSAPSVALLDAYRAGDVREFLSLAVRARQTLVISGGAGAGKTTLLNALIKEVPEAERLVAIEDAAEIALGRQNAVGLIASRGDQGEARVEAGDLLRASLRLRPDRILLGELRGPEAYAFLQAARSGHPGSMTTLHADSPMDALRQIALMALSSGLDLNWTTLNQLIAEQVDVVVQLGRHENGRGVSSIYYRCATSVFGSREPARD